jgi:dTDP-4-dehydrorhamnose reductase
MVAAAEGPVLILGASGRLGRALARVYPDAHRAGHELDIVDPESVRRAMGRLEPSLVFNCAAFTDVDASEEATDLATAVNGLGAGYVAAACAEIGATLVHISTDYVFSGTQDGYVETDPPAPINAYGRSKAFGEARVQAAEGDWRIVRTSRLFGPGENDFASQMRTRSLIKPVVPVIADEWSRFTYLPELASRLQDVVAAPPGVYHLTNEGAVSWYGFARALIPNAAPVSASACRPRGGRALRPRCSALMNTRLRPLRPWREALSEYIRSESERLIR